MKQNSKMVLNILLIVILLISITVIILYIYPSYRTINSGRIYDFNSEQIETDISFSFIPQNTSTVTMNIIHISKQLKYTILIFYWIKY